MTNASGIAADRLLSFVQRWERLQEEKQAIAEDQKEVLKEAKSAGYDVPTIRRMIKERALSEQERQEREALDDTYRAALGMLVDTDLGKSAMERDGVKRAAKPVEGDVHRDAKPRRAIKPMTDAEAADLAAELAKVPGVTSVEIVRATTSAIPPSAEKDNGFAPPKDVAGAISGLKAAMHAPSR